MKDDYSRSISMKCASCGGTQFEYDDEDESSVIRCAECDRVYTRDELMRANQARIDAGIEEMKDDVFEDVRKDLSNIFKDFK